MERHLSLMQGAKAFHLDAVLGGAPIPDAELYFSRVGT